MLVVVFVILSPKRKNEIMTFWGIFFGLSCVNLTVDAKRMIA